MLRLFYGVAHLKLKYLRFLIFALQLLLSLLLLFDLLGLQYYSTYHRVTTKMTFEVDVSVKWVLFIVTGLSFILFHSALNFRRMIPLIITAVLLYFSLGLGYALTITSLLHFILILLTIRPWLPFTASSLALLSILEFSAAVYWLLLYPIGVKGPAESLALLESSIYYLSAQAAPIITTLLLYQWIPQILKPKYFSKLTGFLRASAKIEFRVPPNLLLASSIIISAFSSIYPYLPSLNPSELPVGVDVKHYINYMLMAESNISNVWTASGGSRPIIVLLLLTVKSLTGLSARSTVIYLPLLLNPLLVLSTYILVKTLSEDASYAALTAFFTSMGFKVTVNMYSYFLADLLALIIIYYSISLLFSSIRGHSTFKFLGALILFSLSIFTHPWTYIQYAAILSLYPLSSLIETRSIVEAVKRNREVILLLLISGWIDLSKRFIVGGVEGVSATASTVGSSSSLGILNYWGNMIFSHLFLYGGLQSSLTVISFALLGAIIFWRRGFLGDLLSYSLIASSIPILFVNGTLQSRLIFNLPMEILYATAIYRLIVSQLLSDEVKKWILIFAFSSQAAYLLRSLATLIP